MNTHRIRVNIGMPVFNGENYIRGALESILAQTFTHFRLLISDNASTDATEEICREYSARDNRVSYLRQPKNIGASKNFNFVFKPDDVPYFKWAAHDDVMEPTYLEKCVILLDNNPSFAIAHCGTWRIDKNGNKLGTYDHEIRLNGMRAHDRFWRILWIIHFTEVFGLMRSPLIKKTKLYGSYVGADRNFMAEMLLQGDVGYVDEYLFSRRHHAESFCDALNDNAARLAWFDPEARAPSFLAGPVKFKEYLASIVRLRIPLAERIACIGILTKWGLQRGIENAVGIGEHYRKTLVNRQLK